MRAVTIVIAAALLGACGGAPEAASNEPAAAGGEARPATPAPTNSNAARPEGEVPKETTAGLPAGFPGQGEFRGAECLSFFRLGRDARGRDSADPETEQARSRWEADLRRRVGEAYQQVEEAGVSVIKAVPAAQREAASRWCVDNAPAVAVEREAEGENTAAEQPAEG